MSAQGQKRTSRPEISMSALTPKADMVQHGRDVRFVPKADIEPAHSITSSASCWSCPGTSSPSAFAVLRVTTNLAETFQVQQASAGSPTDLSSE
jgi:hypothetical protein